MTDRDEVAERRRKHLKLIHFSQEDRTFVESEKPNITFADVGGMEDVKKRIRLSFKSFGCFSNGLSCSLSPCTS